MWLYDSVPNAKISGPASAAYTTPRGLKLTYLAALRAMDFGAIGDMVECGVAAGSQLAMMGRAVGDHHSGHTRNLHAFDIEGFDLVGCEIDADYIKAARHRLSVHQSAPRLFDATPTELPQQLSLGDDVLSDGT